MNYGLPYMGSKNRIAKKIIDFLPEGEVLVDLFGGGGAITHCASLSNKWNIIIYNELNSLVYNGFKDAIDGKYNNEKRWISREDFFKLKDTDFYVNSCFSFGNVGKTYIYGKQNELYKKAYHYCIVFNDWIYMKELFPEKWVEYFKEELKDITDIKARRIELAHLLAKYLKEEDNITTKSTISNSDKNETVMQNLESLDRLQNLGRLESLQHLERLDRLQNLQIQEHLERLERLQNLGRLERLEFFNQDYRNVEIPEGAIVYCDIPYANTGKYAVGDFDYDAFYKWVEENKDKYKIYVSSYVLPEDKFREVWSVEKTCKVCGVKSNKTVEKIFIPK